jgi:pimeloyl-ACP methyl ester carboxylesterase
MGGLFARRVGQGPRIVLLHASVFVGELTWREQLPLAERFTLVIVERSGYGHSHSISAGEDLDADGRLVPELLEDGAHLVGNSSGAVAAILAAAQRSEAVLSLTLSEPPAFQLLPDSAERQRVVRQREAQLGASGDDARWLRGFAQMVGSDAPVPDQLPPALAAGVKAFRAVRRRPWEGELPVDELATAAFPKLVISGDHSPVFEALCDHLADRLQAERAHVPGALHMTPWTGRAFNDALEAFITSTTRPQR